MTNLGQTLAMTMTDDNEPDEIIKVTNDQLKILDKPSRS